MSSGTACPHITESVQKKLMKTRLPALAALCLTMGFTSCSYRAFPVEALDRGYRDSMITEAEVETMSDVPIFLSEKDVPEGYKLISFAEFRPFAKSAAASAGQFYKKAVLKTREAGGNALIITGPGQFKIIEIPTVHKISRLNEPVKTLRQVEEKGMDKPEEDIMEKAEETKAEKEKAGRPLLDKLKAEREKIGEKAAERSEARRQKAEEQKDEATKAAAPDVAATPKTAARQEPAKKSSDKDNPIFNDDNLQWFTSKYIYSATEQEQVQIVHALKEEIKDNISICKTKEEAEQITKKIDVLEAYNKALPTPSGTQAAEIKAFRNALSAIFQGNKPESPSRLFNGDKLKGSFQNLLGKVRR